EATWYYTGLGACGKTSNDNQHVVALNPTQYNRGSNCGKHIQIQYGGKSVIAQVVDLCPGCGSGSVDLSPSAFRALASQDVGRIKVNWQFA
ncbi:RlpA-like double-psi beta-barrel-protein domain-containing protein-containing protein, partial [Cyathus striatus]